MRAGVRLILRAASLWLFAIAGTIAVPASIVGHAAPPQGVVAAQHALQASRAIAQDSAAPGSREMVVAQADRVQPGDSVGRNLKQRVFAEDTNPPSGEATDSASAPAHTRPYLLPQAAAPAVPSSLTPVANRQRAP